ncbi:MAG: energy-coupling factor transporter ATPase [Eggerthellaceae bacterium]|nr:energy-coupling factor transporter ATPase [Eggerthellaceae bacterium]MBQ9044158.1 energy-coupling factor transporter ATPase [Eggerthellaceae bacterium]
MAVIEFNDVRFTYDAQRYALDGVNLRIEQGSFTCVLGGNGSGKSTLAKHVNALIAPDEGTVRVLDADTSDPESLYFIRGNAGMVFQNPDDQIVSSVIEDDVAFGPENLGVPTEELQGRVTRALAQVGLQGFEKKETAALSGGQKQRVAIAGVLAMEPQILVLDEASAMLDPRGRKGLARVCRELNEAGLTIMLITHFMEEAAQADRVVVLEAGRVVLEGAPAEVLTQAERLRDLNLDVPFAANMSMELRGSGMGVPVCLTTDELAASLRETASHEIERLVKELRARAFKPAPNEPGAEPILEFKGVSFTYQPTPKRKNRRNAVETAATPADWGNDPSEYWALQNVSLELRRGEFFGIAGHTGSGKSTLIQLANGLLQPTTGTVLVNGRDLADKRAAVEARRDVGVVFQYPENQLFAATVFDDVAFGPRNLGLPSDEVERRVRAAMDLVHLNIDELRDVSPFALSGGQQRRVAFAGVLAMQPTTLILDEPIAGLDPQNRHAFLDLITELHDEQGMTIVLVSHDMNDLARLCDRVLVLNQGKEFALGAPAEVFSDEGRLRSVGLGVPHMVHLANLIAGQSE